KRGRPRAIRPRESRGQGNLPETTPILGGLRLGRGERTARGRGRKTHWRPARQSVAGEIDSGAADKRIGARGCGTMRAAGAIGCSQTAVGIIPAPGLWTSCPDGSSLKDWHGFSCQMVETPLSIVEARFSSPRRKRSPGWNRSLKAWPRPPSTWNRIVSRRSATLTAPDASSYPPYTRRGLPSKMDLLSSSPAISWLYREDR